MHCECEAYTAGPAAEPEQKVDILKSSQTVPEQNSPAHIVPRRCVWLTAARGLDSRNEFHPDRCRQRRALVTSARFDPIERPSRRTSLAGWATQHDE